MEIFNFSKMHGLGNDFVVIDAVRQTISLSEEKIRQLCDRRLGVGCDQVLMVSPAMRGGDFTYSVFNADGSRAGHCGNGARCLASFIYFQKLSDKITLTLEIGEKTIKTTRHINDLVTVHMGKPNIVDDCLFENIMFTCVEIGNAHVITREIISEDVFIKVAQKFQSDRRFNGVNVSMMRPLNHHDLYVKTFERGVGMTPACGSAATACAFLAMENNLVTAPVNVHMVGGNVIVDWEDNTLILTGSSMHVFDGTWYDK